METIKSDFTVIGGGIAGMCAAIAAARHNVRVALVHSRPVLGGNASSEIGITINGAANNGAGPSVYGRETGLMDEIKMTILRLNQEKLNGFTSHDFVMMDAAYFDLVYAEKNITVFMNTTAYDCELENGRITAVMGMQTNSERFFRFESPLFLESSGDGTIAYKSGARFMWGQEGRNDFGESLAPPEKTKYVMGNTILFFPRDVGHPVKFKKPDFAYDVTRQSFWDNIRPELYRVFTREGKLFKDTWWIEIGGLRNTITENENITWELRKIIYGFWDYIKNSGKFEDVENLILERITTLPGKRESRRFIGDYILNQNDIDLKTDFFDAVAIGGWSMDAHAQDGLFDPAPATFWHPVPGMYNYPYRTLYSKDIDNLFIGGRIHSATHLAMSSTRNMATLGVGGQAIGTAASLCKKYGVNPRDITEKHIRELQLLLIDDDDNTIIGFYDEDGVQLLKDTKINVSSRKKCENVIDPVPFDLSRDIAFALSCNERIDSVDIGMKNGDKAEKLTVEVFTGKWREAFVPETLVETLELNVAAGFDGYLTLPINTTHAGDGKIYLVFKANKSISLYGNKNHYPGFVTANSQVNKDPEKYPYAGLIFLRRITENVCFRNMVPESELYGPENLVNGYNRPYGAPNLWISDDRPGEPQSICITFPHPADIEDFVLFFDNCLEYDHFIEIDRRFIKKYTIAAKTEEGDFIETLDNLCGRRFVHHLNKKGVTQIKIDLKETYGAGYFCMYGLKATRLR
jgi:hypothetical protein